MRANNFAISGSNLKKLYQATYRGAGVITWGQILEGCPQQNLGRQKSTKFGMISDNY